MKDFRCQKLRFDDLNKIVLSINPDRPVFRSLKFFREYRLTKWT